MTRRCPFRPFRGDLSGQMSWNVNILPDMTGLVGYQDIASSFEVWDLTTT
jgi:hypothetical protein